MEVRDPVHGSIELSSEETAIVDHGFFQRLRNIKQLGFTEFAFPGATHNRFCHSLGVMHLAGQAFDGIFHDYKFSDESYRRRFRQVARLSTLLHDVGHGPLSHTTEEVMPQVEKLDLKIGDRKNRRANHEDYTLKIITDSSLTDILKKEFPDISPLHIAEMLDPELKSHDDFFMHEGLNFRPILSQLVSSELDVDRMDYLARDSYYCGTSYGHVDSDWIIANLTHHIKDENVHLALNRRALYTFDDFLISRLHMFIMVYFHHKAIIYDEMLLKYLKSPDCDFAIPADLNQYMFYDDYKLHSHMAKSKNPLAQMISQRKPFKLFYESHDEQSNEGVQIYTALTNEGIDFIHTSSTGRLSKYYSGNVHRGPKLFVLEENHISPRKVRPIEETTQIFDQYEDTRKIERLYVNPRDYARAQKIPLPAIKE